MAIIITAPPTYIEYFECGAAAGQIGKTVFSNNQKRI